ncbi:site-specific integrase [Cupriavidus sp. RAF12]|uniref:site-specific integrase n=1 Tax=Cupriavidus sp. RAF12 TaxID=3233050 RepID=UPI003F8F6301
MNRSVAYGRDNAKRAISRNGLEFCPSDDHWHLSRDVNLSLRWIEEETGEPICTSLRKVLMHYAVTASAAHTNNLAWRMAGFVRFVNSSSSGAMRRIRTQDLISYRATLDRAHEWYMAVISGALKTWFKLGYSGIENGVIALLGEWRFRGNIKGEAIALSCPFKGALSELEYEALLAGLDRSHESGTICLSEYVFTRLMIATGRRPAQVGDLKVRDFICVAGESGEREYVLNVPRRKQRGADWRSEFKPCALTADLGEALQQWLDEQRVLLIQRVPVLRQCPDLIEDMPMFPKWADIDKIGRESAVAVGQILQSETLHMETAALKRCLARIAETSQVRSERTGTSLRVFPTRLRRTLGTRAAREGYGELVIAELLDHSDTLNVRVYVENVPEHVDAINAAVAMQLAPMAQAFAGILVDRESAAVRGDDLSSRVRTNDGHGVGTCGHYGFCGALAPIACYTCQHFQPWLDGPHCEVLAWLEADRARVSQLTGDNTIASVTDRTMVAVAQVIRLCDERKASARVKGAL